MTKQIYLPLTAKQEKTLKFITEFINKHNFPPTIKEIQNSLEIKNPGQVFKLLYYLEKKGYIKRNKGEHRNIRLTELSERMENENQFSLF